MPQGVARHNFAPVPPYLTAVAPGAALSLAKLSTVNKASAITLSNGNLTAASSNAADQAGQGDTTIGAGVKRYWEITINSLTGDIGTGWGSTETFTSGTYLGQETFTVGFYSGGGGFNSNAQFGTFLTFAAGDIICWAFTGDTRAWYRVNNGIWDNSGTDDPATATGGFSASGYGTVFPAYDIRNGQITANFGPTFAFTPPSGFAGFP